MGVFTLANLGNLAVLLFLQAVLGFDNLLYISIESQRAPKDKQASVRRNAILIAIGLRIVLLFVMIQLLDVLKEPFFTLDSAFVHGEFTFSVIVFLAGGAFIMYTAVKEIAHMLSLDDLAHDVEGDGTTKTAAQVMGMIILMNLVFSFDSILSALAITDVFVVLATAIVGSGLAMLFMADHVSEFLRRNRKYEVLGLFILLIVGIVLLGEGGHKGHLSFFGYQVEALSKTTFYFSLVVLVVVDVIQTRYRQKLETVAHAERTGHPDPASTTSATPQA